VGDESTVKYHDRGMDLEFSIMIDFEEKNDYYRKTSLPIATGLVVTAVCPSHIKMMTHSLVRHTDGADLTSI